MAVIDFYHCWFDLGDVMVKCVVWSQTAWVQLWAVSFTCSVVPASYLTS